MLKRVGFVVLALLVLAVGGGSLFRERILTVVARRVIETRMAADAHARSTRYALANFDTLLVGGGNARPLDLNLPPGVQAIIVTSTEYEAGAKLWQDEFKA